MMDFDKIINPVVGRIKPSGIRKFFDIAAEMDDVISLGVGEPDFQTPWHIRQAGINALQNGKTRYTANSGLKELREQISEYVSSKLSIKYDPYTEVLVTVGGSEGIDVAVRSLVAPGDEVLIVEPSFVCYEPIVKLAGGVPKIIPTKEENCFRLTPEELIGHITPKTKALVLPYPGNPTGAIMEREDLEKLAEVLRKTDIMVISDEIYSELTYTGRPHVSIASLEGMQERTVIINGFSKTYSMTGWRLGYALGPAPVIKQMTKIHQFGIMSSPTVSQYAAVDALKNGENDIEAMREEYNIRRRLIVGGFRKLGLECFEPMGAFYAFPCIKSTGLSSEEFCERLLYSKKVALVPGNAFGESGEGYVRASYCYSVEHIKEALKRLGEFLEELKDESKG